MSVSLALTAALLPLATLHPTPWFATAECQKAQKIVLEGTDSELRAALDRLQKDRNIELRTCGVWLELAVSERELSMEGPSKAYLDRQNKRLLRLYKHAKVYGKRKPHIADLEIEARMRRVRLLAEKGERTAALKEVQRVEEMLENAEGPDTPTRRYVRGVINLAVSQAAWPLRMLLNLAGISGDQVGGRVDLEALGESNTVYNIDALFLLHHFSRENVGHGDARTLAYGKKIADLFPGNPQFVYDWATDLYKAQRSKESCEVLEAPIRRLDAFPRLWTSRLRAKLFWLGGECALDGGNMNEAKRRTQRAAQENFDELKDPIEALQERLGS